MKQSLIVILTFCSSYCLFAQRVIIEEHSNKIGDTKYTGYSSQINGDDDDIEGKWFKALRTIGRLREEGNFLTVKEAELPEWPDVIIPVYSTITPEDSITSIWITIKLDSMGQDSLDIASEKVRTFLYEFSLNYYKDKAQESIDEAERALVFTEKKLTKLQAEATELKKDSVDNVAEIERLKQLLEKNALEEKVINQKIIDNVAYQDSTALDIERLKKVVDKKREQKASIE